jgi:hypothetical protein
MKYFIFLILLVFQSAFAEKINRPMLSGFGKKIQFPFISVINGQVEVVNAKGEVVEKNLMVSMLENTEIKTFSNSQVRVELEDGAHLVLLPNSHLILQVGSWDAKINSPISLKDGSLRVQRVLSEGVGLGPYIIKTPLSDINFRSGDAIFFFHRESGRVEVVNIDGNIEFSGLGRDENYTLMPQEKGAFQGIIENGELSFDLLLRGRKVARGQLAVKKALSQADLSEFTKATVIPKPKKFLDPKIPQRTARQICDKPFAELNQCVWKCEGAKQKTKVCRSPSVCMRFRCNANGSWSDAAKVNNEKCNVEKGVGTCDY